MATINTLSSLSAKTGFGGLVSGMDIDELVKSYTTRSRQKILKEQQAVQKLEWKQAAYRTVTKALSEFQSSYLDVLSATNFRSSSFFNTAKATSSSSAVSVIGTAAAMEGNIVIDYVSQLAEKQEISSGSPVSKALEGIIAGQTPGSLSADDISSLLSSIGGKSISLSLEGRVRTITFDESFIQSVNSDPTSAGLESALQAAVDKAFGTTNAEDRLITVSIKGDRLSFKADGSEIIVKAVGGDTATLNKLGLSNEQSSRLSLYSSLDSFFFAGDLDPNTNTLKFKINSVEFEIGRDKSLYDIMREINASEAGVTLSYSSIADTFTLTAKDAGAGDNIVINDTEGNLLSVLGLTTDSGAKVEYGKNAVLSVNGQRIQRSSNIFKIDGVNIELLQKTEAGAPPVNISIKEDSSSLKETIQKFLDDYNALVDLISGLVSEKTNPKYPPLSEEQKSEMTEKQIEQWEAKAKAGMLNGDPVLRGILSGLRSAMNSTAKSGGLSLFDMGISSGSYQDNGKLKIVNEAKLLDALKTRAAEISDLFSDSETGLAHKINNIIQKATKKTGVQNQRGTLIELAGIELTSSDTQNNITKNIQAANKRIDALQSRLIADEARLWKKFSAMETALQRLDVQGSMLLQFGSNK